MMADAQLVAETRQTIRRLNLKNQPADQVAERLGQPVELIEPIMMAMDRQQDLGAARRRRKELIAAERKWMHALAGQSYA